MNFEEFREKCMKSAITRDNCFNRLYASNALAGEAGEISNYTKKEVRDGKDFTEEIVLEIFDVLWYCMYLCEVIHIHPEVVIARGFEKLAKR